MYKSGLIKLFTGLFIFIFPLLVNAQRNIDSLSSEITIQECITYALNHQPQINQSIIDEKISKADIRIATSGWYPQLNLDANLQHYFQLPTAFVNDFTNPSGPKTAVPSGLYNNSAVMFSANQTLYSTDLLFASKTIKDYRKLSVQNTRNTIINTEVEVTKSFYDVLLSEEQLKILDEDILRLEQNYKDAYSLYQHDISDKTDYQRSLIALNNAKAQKKTAAESVKAKYAYLKELMGCPSNQEFTIKYDSASFEKEILADTAKILQYENRIEFQILQTDMNLQKFRIGYYRWSFLPTLSAFYDYNLVFQNDLFSDVYKQNYPNSLIGLKISLPLFQGTSRLQNLKKSKLSFARLELQQDYLKSRINTEYIQALSAYKSNLNELFVTKENIKQAKDIYKIIKLQYDQGIKAYIEVIVAETDLRTAELNYLNSLFNVLSSKTDLMKALGEVK